MTTGDTESPEYVYRGVHAKHPMLKAARQGIVIPGELDGDLTPEDHNALNESTISPFTSWSYRESVVRGFASSRGAGGLVLRLPIDDALTEGTGWSWQRSPDLHLESEILLRGIRMGAEVLPNDGQRSNSASAGDGAR